ncbi:MAG: hypothetical protein A3J10_01140 [Candidatus Sungbacteria bacterium RIFCSPLOWO2_02_FULL_54_10]|uniref:Ada DNA repair metal-binding domain-containing protein n=2 Tax=Candidatus Sungiibacteriota TaxID=1817917 RepID=A0A1G2L766_9BACT|nr:MAG: hypothetical protein A2679_01145 [Candidatus Sungbacteria bacterium RIFCSPHIGHO2_01_FULL_54_26]OHA02581.1 MAG: hypothetical protein A3C92_02975 [Candidatus Sungbacteria bacterium RIFCSPHIGHO2_02_FULL_53_17]OHA07380.1 MAG: hypothetical protein A3B34_02910 [Candidatus Sungbacteria bacterium RIFCSPLOWO2_01_FULL_54_21]OHA12719.1 MAG: hypothetical protein A3J10_01140 [Candidatus Sungbacteria bacterium RIFCSPLOWO2_02_FULL_54_10]
MIGHYREKVNAWAGERKNDLFIAAVIFLVGLGSFGLGRLSAIMPSKPPIKVTSPQITDIAAQDASSAAVGAGGLAAKAAATSAAGRYLGSVSGTAYHLPWCPGAQRIKEQNKIWFQTKEEAEKKGYKPAGNCPGL